ncbi:MAG: small multi-drug export protein [Archaeoglobi archaeon]|nr:small multi-drug export protein [Archaeoglobi archaeon]
MEWIDVLVISMLPISELRGAIPYAAIKGLPPAEAYVVSVIGNFLPVPFILFVLHRVEGLIRRIPLIGRLYEYALSLAERRRGAVERYGYPGLTLFVAIPLPVTGAWTGSLIAFLLGLNGRKAMLFILLGIMVAGVIVLSTAYGIKFIIFS